MRKKSTARGVTGEKPGPLPAPGILVALRAAAEPTRLRLLALLAEGDLAVGEIAQIMNQSQPRISRHLRLLAEAGLIERTPEGAWVFHRLAREGEGGRIAGWLAAALDTGAGSMAEDRQRLNAVRKARARAAAAYFRANAKNWDSLRRLHADDAEVERTLVKLLAGPDGREPLGELLDIGTGTGRVLELLGPLSSRCEGIDLSHDMLTLARATLDRAGLAQGSVRHGDIHGLPYGHDSFDVAVIHQVLHFLADPARAVAEAARVLRPGGRLAIADFAPHVVEELRARHAHRRLGFAESEVLDWCRKAGLNPVGVAHIQGRPLTVTLWIARKPRAGEPKPALARWTVRTGKTD
ncbi:MAG: metalloregulator ArsR/SmtB family transcription factor [Rhodospirillales bacterium]|nr:metalloregulator ArsR/SmtB family transcription factor [Rhodospirillales bacterium]MSP81289.1 metalloregulator ArsR/SmtB family transcription factor [Rhodospirillales bacterium]